MKTAVVCSVGEWKTCKPVILKYIQTQQHTIAGLYLTNDVMTNADEIPIFPLDLLDSSKAEQVIFISLYDFTSATSVYQAGIKNILLLHNDGYFLHDAREPLAFQKEQEYIASQNYRKLKQLNRMRMLLSYFHHETELVSYPIDLQIESTSYCNAECIMCGHYIYKNAIAKHISAQLTENLKKYLMYAENVILHGNGEPFLQPDIVDMMHFYGSYGVKLATNTNLSVLNTELLECIKNYFSEITVSMDGCTKEIYENIRINLHFDTLLEHIQLLNDYVPELPKKLAVVAARQNLHQLPDFVMFARKYGFYAVNFIAVGSSEAAQNQRDELRNYPETSSVQLKKAIALAEKYGISLEMPYHLLLPHEPDVQKLEEEQKKMQEIPMFPDKKHSQELFDIYVRPKLEALKSSDKQDICYLDYTASPLTSQAVTVSIPGASCCGICDSVIMRPYILLEGKASTCCLRPKYYTGSILNEESLGLIWNSAEMQEIRAQFYNGKIPSYCAGCSFMNNHFLKLGMFQIANQEGSM